MSLIKNLTENHPARAARTSEGEAAGNGVGTTIQCPANQRPRPSKDFVVTYVDAYDRQPQVSRVGGTGGFMHASSLINLTCERQSVLVQQHGVHVTEQVSGGHRIMWAQGRATEQHIRTAVINTLDGKAIFGVWKCPCGRSKHTGTKPASDMMCQTCQRPLDTYGEPVLRDSAIGITGSPDLTLLVQDHVLVVEIKSMTPDQFDKLEAPLPDHVTQALIYRALYERAGMQVCDVVSIVYGRKQFLWGGAFTKKKVYKEFHVDATKDGNRMIVDEVFARAERIRSAVQSGTRPEREVCSSPESKTAKACPVSHLCFSFR